MFTAILKLIDAGESYSYLPMDMMNWLKNDIDVREVLAGVVNGIVVEDYPEYSKGSCVLVL